MRRSLVIGLFLAGLAGTAHAQGLDPRLLNPPVYSTPKPMGTLNKRPPSYPSYGPGYVSSYTGCCLDAPSSRPRRTWSSDQSPPRPETFKPFQPFRGYSVYSDRGGLDSYPATLRRRRAGEY